MKTLLKKYGHIWVLSYGIIYMLWFTYLEKNVVNYQPVSIKLDELIPFQEIFIIPYLMWFAYIAVTVLYFFFTSKQDFYKCTAFLFIGMTICLIIYTVWPNGQNLRPAVFERNNILVQMVQHIYSIDTATNVCPSIHVYNSIGVHIAIMHCSALKNKKWLRISSFVLMVLICLSTVFLKQHSVFDGLCAILLGAVMYLIIYMPNYRRASASEKRPIPER